MSPFHQVELSKVTANFYEQKFSFAYLFITQNFLLINVSLTSNQIRFSDSNKTNLLYSPRILRTEDSTSLNLCGYILSYNVKLYNNKYKL